MTGTPLLQSSDHFLRDGSDECYHLLNQRKEKHPDKYNDSCRNEGQENRRRIFPKGVLVYG